MESYQESHDAGIQYGKSYRRQHRTRSTDTSVARKAADTLRGTYDYSGFYSGVIKGLHPFSASDFEETFNQNAQLATFKATALLGKVRLQVATQDEAHYRATLEQWESMGAICE